MIKFVEFLKLKEDCGESPIQSQGNADLCTNKLKCRSLDLPQSKFVASMKKTMKKK